MQIQLLKTFLDQWFSHFVKHVRCLITCMKSLWRYLCSFKKSAQNSINVIIVFVLQPRPWWHPALHVSDASRPPTRMIQMIHSAEA